MKIGQMNVKKNWKERTDNNAPFYSLGEFLYALCARRKITKSLVGNWLKEETILIKTDQDKTKF